VRDFSGVQKAASQFVEWANDKLLEKDCEMVLQEALPEKRVRKKTTMPGELAEDEPLAAAERDFEIRVYNVTMDTVTESIHQRFAASGKLCTDFACLDPKNFPEIWDKGLVRSAMQNLSNCLLKFDSRATADTLQAELLSLSRQWERLKLSTLKEYQVRTYTVDDASEGSGDEDTHDVEGPELVNKNVCMCKNCAICVYLVLAQYNLLTDAYHVIGLAYKFLLTLSTTSTKWPARGAFPPLSLLKTDLEAL